MKIIFEFKILFTMFVVANYFLMYYTPLTSKDIPSTTYGKFLSLIGK